jgi:hypothetical protein
MKAEIIKANKNYSEVTYSFDEFVVCVNDNIRKIEVFKAGSNVAVFSAIHSFLDHNPSLAIKIAKRMGIETLGGVAYAPTKIGGCTTTTSSYKI